MRTAAFISIRDKSTRFPGKVMKKIHDQAAAAHLIDRVKTARRPDIVVMTTSTNPDDDSLVALAHQKNIAAFRGDEKDKLKRYVDAADEFDIDFFCVVDGDDLFNDAETLDRIIDEFTARQGDYIICDHLPVGVTSFGVRTEAMRKVLETKAEDDTEVWGGYFTKTGMFDVRLLEPLDASHKRPDLRMTLDYPEDLRFFEAVFDALYVPGKVFPFSEIMKLLNARPQIARINQGVQKLYEQGLRSAAPVRLK